MPLSPEREAAFIAELARHGMATGWRVPSPRTASARPGASQHSPTRVAGYNPWVSLAWLVTEKTTGGVSLYPPAKPARSQDGAQAVDQSEGK